MNRKSLKKFKARWNRVRTFQENEVRNLSLLQKFQQLSSIVELAIRLKMNFKEGKDKIKTRSRWALLKKSIR